MVEQGVNIRFDKDSPGIINEQIQIRANFDGEELQYKFIIGNNGIWNTIQEFSKENTCLWTPEEDGKYIVMVQAKEVNSDKPYDLLAKERYIISSEGKQKLIKEVKIDKPTAMIGEKVNITVESDEKILYRFWIQSNQEWKLVRNYNLDNTLTYTAIKEGKQEILIECKRVESEFNFDEFTTIRFDVLPQMKIEITDFKCVSEHMLINKEITFKVDTNIDSKRTLLYKFVKIDNTGNVCCLQDFSSKKLMTYEESIPGQYRILCLVKDILSNREYDDRALMIYNVKPYKKVKILNFTPNVKSPQMNEGSIYLKADAKGGKELVYRYIINGPIAEDSGYIRKSEYEWKVTTEGEYELNVLVKDASFKGDYEDKKTIPYTINKRAEKPAKIVDIVVDKNKVILVNEPINIKVKAEGDIGIEYSFTVFKDNKEIERVDFGTANWVNYTPEEKGDYEIEVRVKNKYSTKEYDSHTFVYVTARDYLPAKIDYVLFSQRDMYLVGDNIEIESVIQNTDSVQLRYITNINGHVVEDTGFIKNKKIKISPRCPGKYVFDILAKNVKCEEEYDSKKTLTLYVLEAKPIIDTKVICTTDDIKINNEVTFNVTSNGGKDVCYEFYVMERGNWQKVQEYSKKDYYTFIPFVEGEYRIIAFSKSFNKKVSYEDYGEYCFNIEKGEIK